MRKRIISLILALSLAITMIGCSPMESIEDAAKNIQQIRESISMLTEMLAGKEQDDGQDLISDDTADLYNVADVAAPNMSDDMSVLLEELAAKGHYPTKISMTDIYPDENAFYADCETLLQFSKKLARKYKGKLNNVDVIAACCNSLYKGEIIRIFNKISVYVYLGQDISTNDKQYVRAARRLNAVTEQVDNILSFIDDELCALPYDEREAILADPLMEDYRHTLAYILGPDKVECSEDSSEELSISDDVREDEVTESEKVTESGEVSESDEVKADDRLDTVDEISEDSEITDTGINTMADLLSKTVSDNVAGAKVQGYDTYLNKVLSEDGVEQSLIDNNIAATDDAMDDYHRYLSLHKKALGLDKMTVSESMQSSAVYDAEMSFDDMVAATEKALSVYGADYITHLDKIVRSRHVDVYPRDNKTPINYTFDCRDRYILPYIVLNYEGHPEQATYFACGSGSAMYSYYTDNNDELHNGNRYPDLIAKEIASDLNQYIMYNYLIANAENDDEKIFYMESLIGLVNSLVWQQAMLTEFEMSMYSFVEEGGEPDCDILDGEWQKLMTKYYGDELCAPEGVESEWLSEFQLLDSYAGYRYMAGAVYAGAICSRILSGDEEITDKYIHMLSLGNSMKTSDLLKEIDIDQDGMDVYDEFAAWYKDIVNQYAKMINSRVSG